MGGLARRYLRPSNVFLLRMISRITRSPSRTSIPCRRESPPLVRCSTSHSVRMRTQRKPAASKADPISDRSLRLDTHTCFFIVSVVEVIVFIRRRVERRKFAILFPFPDGIAPLRKIPRPADGLGFGGECPQPIAAVKKFVDHSSMRANSFVLFRWRISTVWILCRSIRCSRPLSSTSIIISAPTKSTHPTMPSILAISSKPIITPIATGLPCILHPRFCGPSALPAPGATAPLRKRKTNYPSMPGVYS